MQERLLAMSADNIVRITLPRRPIRRGARGAGPLDRGRRVGAREGPAIYPYEQTYTVDGATITRVGFIALGAVTEYAEKIVLPHERTHSGPKRTACACSSDGADVGLLFMLVPIPTGRCAR